MRRRSRLNPELLGLFAEEPTLWCVYRQDGHKNNILVEKGFVARDAAQVRINKIIDRWTKEHGQDFFVESYPASGWKALKDKLRLLE